MNSNPSVCNPYYIVSPRYIRTSAGIRCLHLLCHQLNLRGYHAYILLNYYDAITLEGAVEPDLLTPLLTRHVAIRHFENQRTPIFIYPDTVSGNPYSGSCIVRYILNFPGLLGGDKSYSNDELCFGYTKKLALSVHQPENVLFIPASDTAVFHPPAKPTQRKGTCFYAAKYKKEHGGTLFDITIKSTEITRDLPTSQTPKEIAELFRKSELFYTYENTALAIESTLCGCPAVFLPNPYLKSIIAGDETGMDGIAWGTDANEISRAKSTVHLATQNYKNTLEIFQHDLSKFIEKTQHFAKNKKYNYMSFHELFEQIPSNEDISEFLDVKNKLQERFYAPLLCKIPWRLENVIGTLLCAAGIDSDGQFLKSRSINRSNYNYNKLKLSRKEQKYARGLLKMPWRLERMIASLLFKIGLDLDGAFIWHRAIKRSRKTKNSDKP